MIFLTSVCSCSFFFYFSFVIRPHITHQDENIAIMQAILYLFRIYVVFLKITCVSYCIYTRGVPNWSTLMYLLVCKP